MVRVMHPAACDGGAPWDVAIDSVIRAGLLWGRCIRDEVDISNGNYECHLSQRGG